MKDCYRFFFINLMVKAPQDINVEGHFGAWDGVMHSRSLHLLQRGIKVER